MLAETVTKIMVRTYFVVYVHGIWFIMIV